MMQNSLTSSIYKRKKNAAQSENNFDHKEVSSIPNIIHIYIQDL